MLKDRKKGQRSKFGSAILFCKYNVFVIFMLFNIIILPYFNLCYVASYYFMLCSVLLHILFYYVAVCYVLYFMLFYYVSLCYVMLCSVMLYYFISFRLISFYVLLY